MYVGCCLGEDIRKQIKKVRCLILHDMHYCTGTLFRLHIFHQNIEYNQIQYRWAQKDKCCQKIGSIKYPKAWNYVCNRHIRILHTSPFDLPMQQECRSYVKKLQYGMYLCTHVHTCS